MSHHLVGVVRRRDAIKYPAKSVMFDVEHFITEVKRRPVLWDPNHDDYNQRHTKLAAWEDVSANLYVDWGDLSNYDKFGKVRDIQNRWKNIRDNYIKELKYERKVEKGLAVAKKNKYKYSHLLDFLNAADKRKSRGSDQSSTDVEESLDIKEEVQQNNVTLTPITKPEAETSSMDTDRKNNNVNHSNSRRAKRFKRNNNILLQLKEQSATSIDSNSNALSIDKDVKAAVKLNNSISKDATQLNVNDYSNKSVYKNSDVGPQTFEDYFNTGLSRNVNTELLSPCVEIHSGFSSLPLEQDDDKMFLLSLLPYFKKLNEEQKLQTRIEMSTLVQNILYRKS